MWKINPQIETASRWKNFREADAIAETYNKGHRNLEAIPRLAEDNDWIIEVWNSDDEKPEMFGYLVKA